MTTMATMDSFDSPMMDFTDDSTAMQIGPSTSWEALMEDDMAHFQTPQDVEIDMETYDDVENPEYEMTDEASVDQRNGDELQDVEVYDVVEEHHDYGSFHGDGAEMHDADTMTLPEASGNTPFMPEAYLESTPISHETHDVSVSHSAEPTEHVVEAQIQHNADFAVAFSETEQQPQEPVHATDPAQPEQHSQDPAYAHTEQETLQETSDTVLDPAADRGENEGVDGWADGQQNQADTADDAHAGDSAGDPHEISEGIYIDPPPPVMLSLHPSSNTFCLFNYPVDEKSDSELVLLLHDYPTLYYEPLSKVFEVLRNEGYITNSYDLVNGELVLDAYELVDLAVSEDNIHATEVSLHDLNVLHDISDLAGPLRIRLECRTPRFIVRYRYLRSELERLLMLGEDKRGESVTDGSAEQQNSATNVEITQEADWHEQHPEEQTTEPLQTAEGYNDEQREHVDHGEQSDHGQILDHGEHPDQSDVSQHDTEQHVNEDDHDEQGGAHDGELDADAEGDTDYGSQSAPDATEVHEHADTDAIAPVDVPSTEFQELQEQNEDYDERFGEDLPNEQQEGETVIIEGELGDDHREEWIAEPTDEPHGTADPPSGEASDVIEEGQVNEYSEAIDLTGDVDSEEALYDDNASASTEHAGTDPIIDDNQETSANLPSVDVTSAETNHTDSSSGGLESEPPFNPDTDNLDDVHWEEEDLGDELDDPEDSQNVESSSADSTSSKTLSSKTASSKRSFDELDLDEVQEVSNPLELSPDPKRQRV